MDTPIKFSQEEIDRYAPYQMMVEFGDGYTDWVLGNPYRQSFYNGVAGQAYDRGAECAMRRQRTKK